MLDDIASEYGASGGGETDSKVSRTRQTIRGKSRIASIEFCGPSDENRPDLEVESERAKEQTDKRLGERVES